MKQNKAIVLAYVAGTIDSDGCIAIKKTKKSKRLISPHYTLQVLLNSPDGRQIDYLYGNYGGRIYKTYANSGKIIWRWEVASRRAANLCKKLIPFLRYKKEQAELAVQFQSKIERHRAKQLPIYEVERREKLYRKMQDLKKIFLAPRAVVETKRDDPLKNGKR